MFERIFGVPASRVHGEGLVVTTACLVVVITRV